MKYIELINEDYTTYIESKGKGKIVDNENVSDDEVLKPAYDLDESVDNQWPEFNMEKDMNNPNLTVGRVFTNIYDFRTAVRMYSILNGFEVNFTKNDKDRAIVVCANNCGWRVDAAGHNGSKVSLQIKSIKGVPHECPWSFKNRFANSRWLSKVFLNEIVDHPELKPKGFKKDIKKKFKVNCTNSQVYRAKNMANESVKGQHRGQYERLRDYCATLLQRNPGSLAFVVSEKHHVHRNPIFKRMFVQFAAQKIGFLNACRPVIGLDACHLKGVMGGQLMSAIGRDANNQMFPIAIALMESECKDSWGWFLDTLSDAIGSPLEKGWIFLSDRQKGLVECIDNKYPGMEHRFCLRHMYANFKLKFKDKQLRDILWAAGRAYVPQKFENKMRELQLVSPEAHAWLRAIPANLWARHTFSPRSKCDLLSNNICESFIQYIKDAREEPVLTMFEAIQRQIMCRFQEKRDWIQKVKTNICPRICQKLEERKKQMACFDALVCTREVYEVTRVAGTFAVNTIQRNCSCFEWNMTGIPCVHACASLVQNEKDPYGYVDHCYSVDAYKKAYEGVIMPIPDQTNWVNSESEPVDPPNIRVALGRPKKVRRKASLEDLHCGKL